MPTVAEAVYVAEQRVLRLDRGVSLPDGTRVKVTLVPLQAEASLARKLAGTIVIDERAARHIVDHEDLWGAT
jgi:predicted DNA-binding antitoxin AbrB/MazE fold protein